MGETMKPTPELVKQVANQFRVVVHLAEAMAEIHREKARIYDDPRCYEAAADTAAVISGPQSASFMEQLGDMLNAMDAADEEDEWTVPIFKEAQRLFPRASPPDAGVVKALKWMEDDTDWWSATTPVGISYEVRRAKSGKIRCRCSGENFRPFDGTVDEAKAAAQANFERRIRSALVATAPETSTSAGVVTDEMVEAAATIIDADLRQALRDYDVSDDAIKGDPERYAASVETARAVLTAAVSPDAPPSEKIPADVVYRLRGAHSALDRALGDTDIDYIESDEELRNEEPVQWAAKEIAQILGFEDAPLPSPDASGLREALEEVIAATQAYLPPDGISAQECLTRILVATDNPTINAAMRGD